jgi:hypothetical protein
MSSCKIGMNLHKKEDLPKIIAMGTNMQGNMKQ